MAYFELGCWTLHGLAPNLGKFEWATAVVFFGPPPLTLSSQPLLRVLLRALVPPSCVGDLGSLGGIYASLAIICQAGFTADFASLLSLFPYVNGKILGST